MTAARVLFAVFLVSAPYELHARRLSPHADFLITDPLSSKVQDLPQSGTASSSSSRRRIMQQQETPAPTYHHLEKEDEYLDTHFLDAPPHPSPPPHPGPSPTPFPTPSPTGAPTPVPPPPPTAAPTDAPTFAPTEKPTFAPTEAPTAPTEAPTTGAPTAPTEAITASPTAAITLSPTAAPTAPPTGAPTLAPAPAPTEAPTEAPSAESDTAVDSPASTDSLEAEDEELAEEKGSPEREIDPEEEPPDEEEPGSVDSDEETMEEKDAAQDAALEDEGLLDSEQEEATPSPTDAPTDALTNSPTEAPTEAPTDAPTDAPVVPGTINDDHPEKADEAKTYEEEVLFDVTSTILLVIAPAFAIAGGRLYKYITPVLLMIAALMAADVLCDHLDTGFTWTIVTFFCVCLVMLIVILRFERGSFALFSALFGLIAGVVGYDASLALAGVTQEYAEFAFLGGSVLLFTLIGTAYPKRVLPLYTSFTGAYGVAASLSWIGFRWGYQDKAFFWPNNYFTLNEDFGDCDEAWCETIGPIAGVLFLVGFYLQGWVIGTGHEKKRTFRQEVESVPLLDIDPGMGPTAGQIATLQQKYKMQDELRKRDKDELKALKKELKKLNKEKEEGTLELESGNDPGGTGPKKKKKYGAIAGCFRS